jgi:hypothetical protein
MHTQSSRSRNTDPGSILSGARMRRLYRCCCSARNDAPSEWDRSRLLRAALASTLSRRRDHDLRWIKESAQHVGGDPRNVVVTAIVGERGGPGDRADREHGAAVRGRESYPGYYLITRSRLSAANCCLDAIPQFASSARCRRGADLGIRTAAHVPHLDLDRRSRGQ